MRGEPRNVYILRSLEGAALYVGLTNNVKRRVCQHGRKPWAWQIATVDTEELPTHAAAVARETELILELRPLHNVRQLPRDRDGEVIDWAVVARRYEAGETYEDLSLDLGVTQSTVAKFLKDRVTPRPAGARAGHQQANPRAITEGRGVGAAARIARPSVARMFR